MDVMFIQWLIIVLIYNIVLYVYNIVLRNIYYVSLFMMIKYRIMSYNICF